MRQLIVTSGEDEIFVLYCWVGPEDSDFYWWNLDKDHPPLSDEAKLEIEERIRTEIAAHRGMWRYHRQQRRERLMRRHAKRFL